MGGVPYQPSWAPRPVRASDSERERASRALRRHYAAGRLELDELERRVEAASRAPTRADLARLFSDLPKQRGAHAWRAFLRFNRIVLRVHAAGFAVVNGGLIGLWALVGGGEFWPAWSLVPGAGLLGWHAGATYLISPKRRRL